MWSWVLRRSGRLLIAATAVLVAVGVLAGCSDGGGGSDGSATPFELPAGWPVPGFPVPPGVDATECGALDDDSFSIAMFEVDQVEVLDFYRAPLPGAGYTITNDDPSIAVLVFEGDVDGQVLAGTGTDSVYVSLTR